MTWRTAVLIITMVVAVGPLAAKDIEELPIYTNLDLSHNDNEPMLGEEAVMNIPEKRDGDPGNSLCEEPFGKCMSKKSAKKKCKGKLDDTLECSNGKHVCCIGVLELELQSLKKKMDNSSSILDSKLESLESNVISKIDTLTSNENNMNSSITSNTKNMESMKEELTNDTNNIKSMDEKLKSNTNNMKTMDEKLTSNTNNIQSLNEKLASQDIELELHEVNIADNHGVAKASSSYASSYGPNAAFEGSYFWHSADPYKFPQTWWVEFPKFVKIVQFSFRSRQDRSDLAVTDGPTKYIFWGSNAYDCKDESKWVKLYEDDSGTPFDGNNTPKSAMISNNIYFRCYGFKITDSPGRSGINPVVIDDLHFYSF